MANSSNIFDLLKSAKAYVATAVALGGLMLTLGVDSNFAQLVPETWPGKIVGIGTLLVAFGGVFGVRNARTIPQAEEDLQLAKQNATKKARTRTTPKPPVAPSE
jgi:hypothetical protein